MTEPRTGQWAHAKERGNYWAMAVLVGLYRFCGRLLIYPVVCLVVAYFFLTRRATRRCSSRYLRRALGRPVGLWSVWRHHLAFGRALMDRIGAWMGRIERSQIAFDGHLTLQELQQNKCGAVLLGAHFGNLEMCRAVVENDGSLKLNVILHERDADKFNRTIKAVNSKSQVRLIPLREVTPATAMILKERLEQGEFLILLADRLPPDNDARAFNELFLGSEARFPEGPFWLALMLGMPVFFIAGFHTGMGYQVVMEQLYSGGRVERSKRNQLCRDILGGYVRTLENYCRRYPYQWFNFYDYWGDDRPGASTGTPSDKSSFKQEHE